MINTIVRNASTCMGVHRGQHLLPFGFCMDALVYLCCVELLQMAMNNLQA